jgi:hypothetical protein
MSPFIMPCVKMLAVSSDSSYFTRCPCQKGPITVNVCDGPTCTCNLNIIFEHVCRRLIDSTTIHLLNFALYIYQPATPFME